jgi:hypothetical protein
MSSRPTSAAEEWRDPLSLVKGFLGQDARPRNDTINIYKYPISPNDYTPLPHPLQPFTFCCSFCYSELSKKEEGHMQTPCCGNELTLGLHCFSSVEEAKVADAGDGILDKIEGEKMTFLVKKSAEGACYQVTIEGGFCPKCGRPLHAA